MVDNAKLIVKQIILNFKFLFSRAMNIVLLLVPALLLTLTVPTILFGMRYGYGYTIMTSLVASLFVAFNGIVYQYRNSTLYKEMKLTKNNKWLFNLGAFATLAILGYLVYIIISILLSMFGLFGLLTFEMTGSLPSGYSYAIWHMDYLWNFYWVGMIILVSYSISFAISRVASSSQVFFIYALSIIIISIVFGGALNNYFQYDSTSQNSSGETIYLFMFKNSNSLFPKEMYIPSILYPFYSQSIMLNIAARESLIRFAEDGSIVVYSPFFKNGGQLLSWHTKLNYEVNGWANDAWRWNILYFMPYIQTTVWMAVGILAGRITNTK